MLQSMNLLEYLSGTNITNTHIVQTKEWGQFKTKFGTTAIRVDDIQYTVHKVPHTNFNYAYCPKIDPQKINWEALEKSLKENNCFVLNIDVPNVIKGSKAEEKANEIFEKAQNKLKKSPKNTFTKNNVVLDLDRPEDEILASMHKKHRYNIGLSERKGVTIRYARTEKDFDVFFDILRETSKRQGFLIHPKTYYKTLWEIFAPREMAEILIAEYKNEDGVVENLASWMLFVNEDVLYYPYGGDLMTRKNLHASNLLGWEAIKYGKKRGCTIFDMWGACKDISDENDPEWGFTNFKLKFGGEYVEYIDSYDYVLNHFLYNAFTFAYPKVIKLLKFLKR